MSDRESSRVGFRLRGFGPSDLSTYPDSVKLMFWNWVVEYGLEAKDFDRLERRSTAVRDLHLWAGIHDLMERWERIIEQDNRMGVLGNSDKDGKPATRHHGQRHSVHHGPENGGVGRFLRGHDLDCLPDRRDNQRHGGNRRRDRRHDRQLDSYRAGLREPRPA